MQNPFRGVYVVMCTPFTKDGSVDEQALRQHVRNLIDVGGVHGVMPVGSTGEFAALTDDEIRRVIDVTVDEVAGQIPVVAGTAAVSTAKTIANTQYAKDAGADGALIVSPYYCHPNAEEIVGHFRAVSGAVDLPIMLYNNPGTSGVDIWPETVAQVAECDNIVCIKESSGDMTRVCDIMRRCGDKIDVFCGCDTLVMEMLLMGAVGWVAPPANFIPELCVSLHDAIVVDKDIDAARKLYYKMLPLLHMFESTGQYIQLSKAALNILDRPYGIPRLPLLPASDGAQRRLKAILDSVLG